MLRITEKQSVQNDFNKALHERHFINPELQLGGRLRENIKVFWRDFWLFSFGEDKNRDKTFNGEKPLNLNLYRWDGKANCLPAGGLSRRCFGEWKVEFKIKKAEDKLRPCKTLKKIILLLLPSCILQ